MKTLLIPVDFTATTDNAVTFGAEWCKKYEYKRIILLKTFYSNIFDHIVVSAEYSPVSQDYMRKEREDAREQLESLSKRLAATVAGDVIIATAISEEPLLRSIVEITELESPDLIILGSNNYNASNKSLISDNIIAITKVSMAKVLIVPVTYTYKPVEVALVPANFNSLETIDKMNSLRASPLWDDTNLLVLNVDPKERYLDPDSLFMENESNLHHYLKNFKHTIHYSNARNIIRGILDFIHTHNIDIIIAMPGKYSFLYSLTHKSISEAIYLNAKEPVLILK